VNVGGGMGAVAGGGAGEALETGALDVTGDGGALDNTGVAGSAGSAETVVAGADDGVAVAAGSRVAAASVPSRPPTPPRAPGLPAAEVWVTSLGAGVADGGGGACAGEVVNSVMSALCGLPPAPGERESWPTNATRPTRTATPAMVVAIFRPRWPEGAAGG